MTDAMNDRSNWLAGSITPTAVLRSIALSLMDTADRVAEWLRLSSGNGPAE